MCKEGEKLVKERSWRHGAQTPRSSPGPGPSDQRFLSCKPCGRSRRWHSSGLPHAGPRDLSARFPFAQSVDRGVEPSEWLGVAPAGSGPAYRHGHSTRSAGGRVGSAGAGGRGKVLYFSLFPSKKSLGAGAQRCGWGPGSHRRLGWLAASHGVLVGARAGGRVAKSNGKRQEERLGVKECRSFINRVYRNFLLGRNIDS